MSRIQELMEQMRDGPDGAETVSESSSGNIVAKIQGELRWIKNTGLGELMGHVEEAWDKKLDMKPALLKGVLMSVEMASKLISASIGVFKMTKAGRTNTQPYYEKMFAKVRQWTSSLKAR